MTRDDIFGLSLATFRCPDKQIEKVKDDVLFNIQKMQLLKSLCTRSYQVLCTIKKRSFTVGHARWLTKKADSVKIFNCGLDIRSLIIKLDGTN